MAEVWGLSCTIEGREPVVRGVRLRGSPDAPEVVERVELRPNPQHDWSRKLMSLRDELHTRLDRQDIDALVIRALDVSPFGRRRDDARIHHQVEGLVLATAREFVPLVEDRNGQRIGDACGTSKDAAEAAGARLAGSAYRQAAAAALAALHLTS